MPSRASFWTAFRGKFAQAEALQKMLAELGTPLEAVVLLNLDLGILFKRLTGRRICETCGQVFNIYTSPPGHADCEKCGDKPHRLIQRQDDKEEVIGKRLDVYEAQTKPLIKHYRERRTAARRGCRRRYGHGIQEHSEGSWRTQSA